MTDATNDLNWYTFGGSGLQPRYGYGTEAEAEAYAAHLNQDRDINCYQVWLTDDDEAADLDSGRRDDGFNIDEELAAIELE